MKGRIAVLGEVGGKRAAALIVDGLLDDFLIDTDDDKIPAPGAIFRAICDRPLKGLGGMMLRLPGGTGFLRGASGLRPGQPLLVQVTGYSEPGKAVPVTSRLLFKSKYAIVTPEAPGINVSRAIKDEEMRVRLLEIAHEIGGDDPSFGLIVRSEAERASNEDIANDITDMAELATAVMGDTVGSEPELLVEGVDAHTLAWREWGQVETVADAPNAFEDFGVLEMIDSLLAPRMGLAGGGYCYIEPTRALVAVDVNTGGDTSPAAGLKANIATARLLPAQLRSRGLGGQITIDFAPMAKKDRRQLEQVLKTAFRGDAIETAFAGWTPLGHFELQRKRERLPLHEILTL